MEVGEVLLTENLTVRLSGGLFGELYKKNCPISCLVG